MNITLADKMSNYEMRQRDDYHPVKPRIRGEIDQSGQSAVPSPVPSATPLATPSAEPAPVPVVASGGFGSGIINAGKGLFTSVRDNKMIALGIVIVIIIIAIFAYIVYRREPAEVTRPPRAAGGGQTNEPIAGSQAGGQTENGAGPTGNTNNTGGQMQSTVTNQAADNTTRPELSVSSLYQRARAAAAKTAEPSRPSKDEEMSKLMEDVLVENDAIAKTQSTELAKTQSVELAETQSTTSEVWGLADDTTESTATEYVVTEPAAGVTEETAPAETVAQEVTPTPGCCDMWLGTRYCRNKASAGGKCHFHR